MRLDPVDSHVENVNSDVQLIRDFPYPKPMNFAHPNVYFPYYLDSSPGSKNPDVLISSFQGHFYQILPSYLSFSSCLSSFLGFSNFSCFLYQNHADYYRVNLSLC